MAVTLAAPSLVPSRFEERSEYDGRLRFLPSNEEHAPPPGQGTPFRFLTHVQTLYKDTKTDPASFSQSDSDEVTCIFQLHNRFW